MPMQEVTYRTYEDCFRALTGMKADVAEVTSLLDHEKQHFEHAVKLGYNPVYGIRMVPDFPPIIDFGFIDFKGNKPVGHDMIAILLAPDKPGKDDLELVERIRTGLG